MSLTVQEIQRRKKILEDQASELTKTPLNNNGAYRMFGQTGASLVINTKYDQARFPFLPGTVCFNSINKDALCICIGIGPGNHGVPTLYFLREGAKGITYFDARKQTASCYEKHGVVPIPAEVIETAEIIEEIEVVKTAEVVESVTVKGSIKRMFHLDKVLS